MADPDSARADVRDPVARDLDIRAAHAHLDAVVADVLDAAAGDGASFGVVKQQCAGHLDSGLQRRGIVGRRLPFRMRKGETLKTKVVDRGALAPNHPHHLRQPRGDDLSRRHLLSRSRQIVQHSAGTIQIPLARSVQGLEDVLHPVDRGHGGAVAGGGGRDEGKQARAIERDCPGCAVNALNRQPVVQPSRDPHDFHVLQIAPGRHDVARGVDELLRRTPEKVARIARQRFDAVFPLLRQPCPRPAFAIDEELPKTPRPRLHLRDVHHPGLATVDLAPAAVLRDGVPRSEPLSPPLPPRKPPEPAPSPNPPGPNSSGESR